jgi:hypothetical protein
VDLLAATAVGGALTPVSAASLVAPHAGRPLQVRNEAHHDHHRAPAPTTVSETLGRGDRRSDRRGRASPGDRPPPHRGAPTGGAVPPAQRRLRDIRRRNDPPRHAGDLPDRGDNLRGGRHRRPADRVDLVPAARQSATGSNAPV